MITLLSLWLPILLSAVVVFIASSVIHMVLGYHKYDWKQVPAQGDVMQSLRNFKIPPGDYMLPCPDSPGQMNTPEFKALAEQGPRITMTVLPGGQSSMGKNLVFWFIYCIVVSKFAGYVASVVLAAGTPYITVFRITSVVAFAGYALAHWQSTVWYSRSVGTTLRNTLDGLIYALLTGGVFGWLWPHI